MSDSKVPDSVGMEIQTCYPTCSSLKYCTSCTYYPHWSGGCNMAVLDVTQGLSVCPS